MRARVLASILFVQAVSGASQRPPSPPGPPATDIWLARLTDAGIEQPINITNRPGYDNQPSFTPDGKGILFTRSDPSSPATTAQPASASSTSPQPALAPSDSAPPASVPGASARSAPSDSARPASAPGASGSAYAKSASGRPASASSAAALPAVAQSASAGQAQTDIYLYDFTSRSSELTRVINTPESEYSPTVTPDGQGISVIRVEAGAPASLAPEARQRLWRFTRDGQNPTLVLRDIKPVGYHAWGPDGLLAIYVLGKPNTLQVADSRTGRARVVAQNVGRSIHRIPGRDTVSVLHIEGTVRTIKELDLRTRTLKPIVRAVESGDGDYAWTPDGAILMSTGKELMRWKGGDWTRLADLAALGLAGASRLAVSPDGRWLAIVVPEVR